MNTEAALNAARRLSVDVANLTYRLALAEAVQDELRGLLFYEGLDGIPLRRIDPDMWQRRPADMPEGYDGPVPIQTILTQDQADAAASILHALEHLL
jgi:hypothetical protein